jgi:hypothetical protein
MQNITPSWCLELETGDTRTVLVYWVWRHFTNAELEGIWSSYSSSTMASTKCPGLTLWCNVVLSHKLVQQGESEDTREDSPGSPQLNVCRGPTSSRTELLTIGMPCQPKLPTLNQSTSSRISTTPSSLAYDFTNAH